MAHTFPGSMHVLVTGASGFVGSHLVPALLAEGHTVRALSRSPQADPREGVTAVHGDVTDLGSLAGAFEGIDAVVHLVGIIDETPSKGVTFERIHVDGTRNVAHSAKEAGVERFVHMSANGARADGRSEYQTTKWRAEEIARGVGFEHLVVFRPSTLFGDPGPTNPEFAKRLWETLVKPFPVLPVFGNGKYELQPIHVQACADAMAAALTRDEAAGESYTVAGHERIAYKEVLRRIARGGGIEPKPTAPVPIFAARIGVNTLGKAGLLPISPAQFEMLVEGNVGDPTAFFEDFGVTTPPFDAENLSYLART